MEGGRVEETQKEEEDSRWRGGEEKDDRSSTGVRRLDTALRSWWRTRPTRMLVDSRDRGNQSEMRSGPQKIPKGTS
jgi:hypothetical protein